MQTILWIQANFQRERDDVPYSIEHCYAVTDYESSPSSIESHTASFTQMLHIAMF